MGRSAGPPVTSLGIQFAGGTGAGASKRSSVPFITEYQRALAQARFQCSMSRRGNCLDNAVTESFMATMKHELFHRTHWFGPYEAEQTIAQYIEGFYNIHRRHSAIGKISPAEFERRHRQEVGDAA